MTWRRGTLTEPAGSKPRDGIEITCDEPGCYAFEIIGAHGGSVEKVQRLLVKRGWGWTQVIDGARDLCPRHARQAVAS